MSSFGKARGLRRRAMLALPAMAAPALAARPAAAEGPYPDRPVTLVAPFSAGGAADIAARILAANAPRHLSSPPQPMVVENRTGASGAVGTAHVARAKPDGYTLLLARVGSSAILPAIDSRTGYAWDEFTMLSLLDENPFVVCVRADAPWKTMAELLSALRETPGTLNFATTGPATILDLGIRQMFVTAGLPLDAGVAVPFRGGGEAVAALVGGQVQFIGNNLSDTSAAIANRQLRALMVGAPQRLPDLPGVPTAKEAELEAMQALTGWNALFGPKGLPEPVTAAWGRAITRLRQDRDWQNATRRVGSRARLLGPEETLAFVRGQVEMYRALGRRLGMA